MTSPKPLAGSAFPALNIPVLTGGKRALSKPKDGFDWQLIVAYRGKHCPICTRYLQELNAALPGLNAIGVDVIAISADDEDRAGGHMDEVQPLYDVGYDLSVPQMQALGLYISGPRNGMNVERPFAEPGLFVVNAEGDLQLVDISNVPFARPDLQSILRGLTFLRGLTDPFPVNGSYV
ncbi:redoxin domain-containing protein [Fontisubflavum oceani]|uniref:redoxin domain-containing protein n=1 Tax=Fontisubflavum oceani TaxID=2978973 RepID=UPI0025B38DA9|nr:redoxin domain-containing protein [Fontisubflavum oceani]WJY21777.1 redoxin domain-containing protein [Fontisubflavum oceani]